MMKFAWLVIAAAFHPGPQPAKAQSGDRELVARFVSPIVTEDTESHFEATGTRLSERFDFASADLDQSGRQDYLAAVYSNGAVAAVRLLRKEDGDATVVAEPVGLAMVGSFGIVETRDLDGDRIPELIVTVVSPRARSVWPFRWTGSDLQSMAPLDRGMTSQLADTWFSDINGDGVLEALGAPRLASDGAAKVYRQNAAGVYEETPDRIYYRGLFPSGESGSAQTDIFDIVDSNPLYALRILNGQRGEDRVSSAEIWLNGSQVVTDGQLNREVAQRVVPVSLLSTNTLEVRLTADATGFIYALIEPFQ